jgi:hypothetical protein
MAINVITELLDFQLKGTHTAASVGEWLGEHGIKLLPWQRKRMGLPPAPNKPQKAMNT